MSFFKSLIKCFSYIFLGLGTITTSNAADEVINGSLCWALTVYEKEQQTPTYAITFFDNSLSEIHSINLNATDKVSHLKDQKKITIYNNMLDSSITSIVPKKSQSSSQWFVDECNSGFFSLSSLDVKNCLAWGIIGPVVSFYDKQQPNNSGFYTFLSLINNPKILFKGKGIELEDKIIYFTGQDIKNKTTVTVAFTDTMASRINEAAKTTIALHSHYAKKPKQNFFIRNFSAIAGIMSFAIALSLGGYGTYRLYKYLINQ